MVRVVAWVPTPHSHLNPFTSPHPSIVSHPLQQQWTEQMSSNREFTGYFGIERLTNKELDNICNSSAIRYWKVANITGVYIGHITGCKIVTSGTVCLRKCKLIPNLTSIICRFKWSFLVLLVKSLIVSYRVHQIKPS